MPENSAMPSTTVDSSSMVSPPRLPHMEGIVMTGLIHLVGMRLLRLVFRRLPWPVWMRSKTGSSGLGRCVAF